MNRQVENVVMKGPEVGKLVKEQHLKSIVMNGVKKRKGDMVTTVRVENLENWKIVKMTKKR